DQERARALGRELLRVIDADRAVARARRVARLAVGLLEGLVLRVRGRELVPVLERGRVDLELARRLLRAVARAGRRRLGRAGRDREVELGERVERLELDGRAGVLRTVRVDVLAGGLERRGELERRREPTLAVAREALEDRPVERLGAVRADDADRDD